MELENIVVDITQRNYNTIQTIQYDVDSRYVNVKIVSSGKNVDLTNYMVSIACKKPDGKIVFNETEIVEPKQGLIKFLISEQISSTLGEVVCELKIYGKNSSVLTTQYFTINVTQPIADKSIQSTNEFRQLTVAMNEYNAWISKVEEKYNELEDEYAEELSVISNKIYVSVKDFGGKCDGVTDDTNALIKACQSGQPIYISDNVLVTGKVNTGSCPKLFGTGKITFSANSTLLEVGGNSFAIEGLTLQSTNKESNNVAIDCNGKGKLKFNNLTISGFNVGVKGGYHIAPYEQGVLSNSVVTGCNTALSFPERSEYFVVNGCIINSNLVGFDIIGGNISVNSCTITNNTQYAIKIGSGQNGGHGLISGNQINHNGIIEMASVPNGYTMTGNNIFYSDIVIKDNKTIGGDIVIVGNTISTKITLSNASCVIGQNSYGANISFICDINSDVVSYGNKSGYNQKLDQVRVKNFVEGKALRLTHRDTSSFANDVIKEGSNNIVTKWNSVVWALNYGAYSATGSEIEWYDESNCAIKVTKTSSPFIEVHVNIGFMINTSTLGTNIPVLSLKLNNEIKYLPFTTMTNGGDTLFFIDTVVNLLSQPPLNTEEYQIKMICNDAFYSLKDSITPLVSGFTGFRGSSITFKGL